MFSRIALFAASLVAALAIAGGLALAGLAPAGPATAPVSDPVVATTGTPAPTVQVDTVYLAPDPTPQDVTVTKVVQAKSHGDEDGEDDGNESEGGDD